MRNNIWHITDDFEKLPVREVLRHIFRDDRRNYKRAELEFHEDISRITATRDLTRLVKEGILIIASTGKREMCYILNDAKYNSLWLYLNGFDGRDGFSSSPE